MPNEKSTHKSTHIAKSHGLSRPFGKPTHKPKLGKECAYPNPRRNSIFFSLLLKILKHPTRKTNTTKTMKLNNDNGLLTRWTRTPAGNSVLPQLAVTCKIEAECSYQTFVQVDSEVLRNRQLRQHANRYMKLAQKIWR